jgi:hypothetical protein
VLNGLKSSGDDENRESSSTVLLVFTLLLTTFGGSLHRHSLQPLPHPPRFRLPLRPFPPHAAISLHSVPYLLARDEAECFVEMAKALLVALPASAVDIGVSVGMDMHNGVDVGESLILDRRLLGTISVANLDPEPSPEMLI